MQRLLITYPKLLNVSMIENIPFNFNNVLNEILEEN